ncbi:MAG: hypothetical protein HBSAPP03_09730 [Phycisphaerae bacterium]|nr:MAG: hypothetical protein HBSAPP03_09730 [Phycisphaerae bacterium]
MRVCYLTRTDRGGSIRTVRLVGQASDETFPPEGALAGTPEDVEAAARWVRERLASTHTAEAIAVLCLDPEGGVCTPVATPSTDPAVLAASVRFGSGDGARAGGGAFDYFAPGDDDSSLEALPAPRPGAGSVRAAVLGVTDVPARLLLDALDREGIPVESVSTLWHAMARAWDPGSPRAGADDAPADAGPLTAVLLVDPAGRLVWCWSAAGTLRCAGALRLRTRPGTNDKPEPCVGPDDAARLAAEWLSWAVQLGKSPRRAVCIMPPQEDAAAFGESLGRSWAGMTIDAVGHEDPLGATMRRLADAVENTPRTGPRIVGDGLRALSSRPGRAHRGMFRWRALGLFVGAAAIIVAGWQLARAGERAMADTKDWETKWRGVIGEVYPDGLRPTPQTSPLKLLTDEVRRRERESLPVERTDIPMPVLHEFETLSLVLASAGCGIERVEVDSATRPVVVALVKSSEQAEDILQGLQRIGGSYAQGWTLTMRDLPGAAERRIRAEYRGEWDREAVKKGSRP